MLNFVKIVLSKFIPVPEFSNGTSFLACYLKTVKLKDDVTNALLYF